MPKVVVERIKCGSLGVCESLAPDVFEVNDAGELQFLTEGAVPDSAIDDVRAAVAGCPAEALTLVED